MKKLSICFLLIVGISILLVINWPKVEKNVVINEMIERRSIFISYIELSKYLNGKSVGESRENIKMMIGNVKKIGFNEVILQVRSFADAIYKSKIFPWSRVVSLEEGVDPGYDVLKVFIEEAKKEDVSIVAWINPYRIRNSEDISDLSVDSPAYKYLNSDIVYINGGAYFNPSKQETRDLIVDGVLELITNYDIDGVLFDDYFYPDNEIDRKDYEEYLKNNKFITKDKYNLEVVNELIKSVYTVCNKNGVRFGISPDGNMENNYSKVYADVKKWCSSNEYIDFIMPQVYYGFFNETKAFKKVVDEWEGIILNDDIELVVALAFYKVGGEDMWAKSGKYEWMENNDIIMREIILSRNLDKYKGFSLFRYDFLFDEGLYTNTTMAELENMKKVLN